MKTILKLALVCCMAVFHLSAVAAPIVDQENPNPYAGFCFVNDGTACGQSFRQDNSNISGVGFFVDPGYGDGTFGTVTLSVFSAYSGAGPAGLIASGTAANVGRNSGWIDVFFAPAAITAGDKYYLIIESTNSIVASYGRNDYADGSAVFNGSEMTYSGYDLNFRTYYDNNVTQVPEPGSLALLGLGIAGIGFARRKKHV